MGNRILKKLLDVDTQKATKTYYTRDAQGNVLSIYENGKQTEIPIYGSDRIGTPTGLSLQKSKTIASISEAILVILY